uniref:BTB domain-containing protein n=1 Tax=Denticeps clupeoides TaxID=299321 RepID=A0AAY4BPF1_9TELE
ITKPPFVSTAGPQSLQDPVSVNVGGEVYVTTLDTLTRCRDSMLGAMFTGQMKDRHGNFFIDRDGRVFRYVLNYLRSNSLDLPEGFAELPLLKREADFFQIRPLLEEIQRRESGLAPGGPSGRGAMLNVDTESHVRTLHFNLKRGPDNYELCSCSVHVHTATVFCTARVFVDLLCSRFAYRGQEGTAAPRPRDGSRNYLHLEWAPCPQELPRDQHQKHGFRELHGEAGTELSDLRAFVEELLRVALAEGFRVDSVFPDSSDILNCRSLRFVRY